MLSNFPQLFKVYINWLQSETIQYFSLWLSPHYRHDNHLFVVEIWCISEHTKECEPCPKFVTNIFRSQSIAKQNKTNKQTKTATDKERNKPSNGELWSVYKLTPVAVSCLTFLLWFEHGTINFFPKVMVTVGSAASIQPFLYCFLPHLPC